MYGAVLDLHSHSCAELTGGGGGEQGQQPRPSEMHELTKRSKTLPQPQLPVQVCPQQDGGGGCKAEKHNIRSEHTDELDASRSTWWFDNWTSYQSVACSIGLQGCARCAPPLDF